MNGRLALTDIDLGRSGATATIAIWARNLLNEQHAYYRSYSPLSGGTGIFNEARTFGVELGVKL